MTVLARLLVVVAALLFGSLAQAQGTTQQAPSARAEQPFNNAPLWREVRKEGQEHYTSVKGREAGVLVQSAGDTWRKIRNGPVTFYGGWLLVIVVLAIAALYFAKGPIRLSEKPTGRLMQRFTSVERAIHWSTAISFCVLALTGLLMLFGKHFLLPVIGYTLFGWLTALGKNLHNFIAPLFIVSVVAMIFMWAKDNLPRPGDLQWFARAWAFIMQKDHPPSGRFNAGEKTWFWGGVLGLSVVSAVTGLILLFPNFDQTRATMQDAWVIHAVSALVYVVMALGHIYVGTIGVEGAYQSMRTGYVDEVWARDHHLWWYEEQKAKLSGRRPATGGPVPAGAVHMRNE